MKYMGSKLKISKYIVPIIQSYMTDKTNYVEPFVGGCNVIDKIKANIKYGNDINKYLIALFKELIKYPNSLFIPDMITRIEYSNVRSAIKYDNYNYEDWYIGLVGFLASFNGRFFDGGYSGTNTDKNGKTRNYYTESLNNILTQIKTGNLNDVIFSSLDYLDFISINEFKNCVIYLDPPYKDTKNYNQKPIDYNLFYQICKKLSENNRVIISEQYMPNEFTIIYEQEIIRSINPKNKISKVEKLYTLN